MTLSESTIESAILDWLGSLGYSVGRGPDFSPGGAGAERESFTDVVLVGRLRDAVERLNAGVPLEAREEAAPPSVRPPRPARAATTISVASKFIEDPLAADVPQSGERWAWSAR